MASTGLFLIGLFATLLLGTSAVAYLRRPLMTILIELCGSRERATFWVAFSNVAVLLVPLLFAMQYTPATTAGAPALLEVAAQLKWALAGLLGAICVLAYVIGRFIRHRPLAAEPWSRAA